ncbi:alkaline phosphatase PhoX [Haliea sp. E17]|uniref:alkaline phosphatase PhoX n=1 Tax=Haliea sp. E17 TaxID=3401576 RepID=UPI003AAD2752
MSKFTKGMLAAGVLLANAQMVSADNARQQGDIFFYPLTQSAAVATVEGTTGKKSHFNELNHPWQTPPGVSQTNLTSMSEIEADINQSVVRVVNQGTSATMWDMIAFDPTGQYIFIPHETPVGAGVSRYDTMTDTTVMLFSGDGNGLSGDWGEEGSPTDFGAFDPSTFTPNGTLLLAEEWAGQGRVIEVLNPIAASENGAIIRELTGIPNVAHEGLRFSHDGGALYFVDEWNSGSLYKIVFNDAEDYSQGGTSYVLQVDDFIANGGDAAANWDSGVNADIRTGAATWIEITGTATDPLKNGISSDCGNPDTFGGRCAADELDGTPFGRPEDMEVSYTRSGDTVVYFAATSEHSVYSVIENGDGTALVQVLVSDAETPKNLGFPGTTAILNSPDNLAQDMYGNIFVIEDQPNGGDRGGDIWFVRDTDRDGVAESLDHFLSHVVDGAEATGMIFNPVSPDEFVVSIQHPDSTDLAKYPEGFGDALWKFDISEVNEPREFERKSNRDHDKSKKKSK